VTVTVNVSSYSALGSGGTDGIPPFLEVWTKRKGKLLQRIGEAMTPVEPGGILYTFVSDGSSGIVLGEGNQIRILIRSLNRDKASTANDQVEIDFVEIEITP